MKNKKVLLVLLTVASISISACGKNSADSHYKNGNAHLQNGRYAEALADYEEAINENTERAEYYIAAGLADIGLEKYEEAINYFDKGYSPKDNQIVRENNKTLARGKGIALLKLGRYEEALAEFEKALLIKEADVLDEDIKKYSALVKIKIGDYSGAITIYEDLLKAKNPDVSLYGKLASAYSVTGDREKAIANYDLAISREPDRFEAYFGKYELLAGAGEETKANEVLEKAAGIKIKDDTDSYNAGVLEYLRKNYAKAKEYLNTAYGKQIYESAYYLGRIALSEGDFTTAKTFFESYEKDREKVTLSGWFDGMAECKIKEEGYKEALDYVLKGLALEDISFMKKLLFKKVQLYEKLVDYDSAYKAAKEYVKLYPDDKDMAREVTFLSTRKSK